MSQIQVLIVPVTGAVHAETVENDLFVFQALVGGYIECVTLAQKKRRATLLYVNEEGILRGLPVNTRLTDAFGLPLLEQPLYGSGFIAAIEAEGPGFEPKEVSLTEDEVAAWSRLLARGNSRSFDGGRS